MEIKLLPYDDRQFWKAEGKPTAYDCPLCNKNNTVKHKTTFTIIVKPKVCKQIKGNRKQRSVFKHLDKGRWKLHTITIPVSDWISVKALV